jgi:hypothetical protein
MSGKGNVGSTLIIVAQLIYNSSYGHPFNRGGSLMTSYGTISDMWGSNQAATFVVPTQLQTNPMIYALSCKPDGCKMYFNDPTIVRASSAFNSAAYETDVWMRFWTTNSLGELRLYEGSMPDAQRIEIFNTLKSKWGIP